MFRSERRLFISYRICLINPGKILQPHPPLGLAYIAAYLRKHGARKYDIKIADENTGENIERIIRKFSPDMAGITAATPQILRAAEVAAFIKKINKRIPVILGGPHISALPDITLQDMNFDIGVIGEGEAAFCELADSVFQAAGGFYAARLTKINGLVFKADGQTIITSPRTMMADIDSIGHPARDLLDMDFYLRPGLMIRSHLLRATTIFTSRGCPYNCKFCASPFLTKRMVRFHSAEFVLSEVNALRLAYPKLQGLFFMDDTFTLNSQRIRDICDGFIAAGLNKQLVWNCQGRANLIKRQELTLYQLMKRAGCIQIEFGFESGSDRILDFIKGGSVNVRQNQAAIDIINEAGMDIFGNFLAGIPTENRQDMLMTEDFVARNLKKLKFFQIHFLTPYPGTQFWNDYNLIAEAANPGFWKLFNSGYSGYRRSLLALFKDVDINLALEAVRRINYLAARQVSFRYKLKWFMTRVLYAPSFALKKLFTFLMMFILSFFMKQDKKGDSKNGFSGEQDPVIKN